MLGPLAGGRLRPGDLECEILKDMLAEQRYRDALKKNYTDLEQRVDKWFDGTKFQNITTQVRTAHVSPVRTARIADATTTCP